MNTSKCIVERCDGTFYGKGFCRKHFVRLQRGKNPHEKSRFEKTVEERLDEKYVIDSESNCWIWTGALSDVGYGSFNGQSAHRAMYKRFKGEIPHGMYVMHSCDNRKCVNPDHLSVGTPKDNMQDAVKKGRTARREMLPQFSHGRYSIYCAVGG